ncbi:MAG: sigma-70 family RNA polymerase sigma factor [Ruminococcus sp.]|nr:sigma-70 family RNA polymerase sigma factor [Ruminococcus sp.]
MDVLLEFDFNLNAYSSKTDEELVVLAKNEKSAAAALVARYSKLVWVKSKIYANSDTDSEDLNQEGLMTLLKAINAFDPRRGVKFSTFAEVCIVNCMRTISAKSGKDLLSSQPIDETEEEDFLADEETPESIYLYKEFFSELLRSIETSLSPTELRVFNLCVQGNSYKQTAEKLGMTEKAVDNAMQRARKKIRTNFS